MKTENRPSFTVTELWVVLGMIALVGIPIGCGGEAAFGSARQKAYQAKQLNNVKQIAVACILFAGDNNGRLPNGTFDSEKGKLMGEDPAGDAETCFEDLIKGEYMPVEKIFWSPWQTTQCAPDAPDEDGNLTPEENGWDFIAGLHNAVPASIPVAVEASDGGDGKVWSEAGGHPWDRHVIVGYVDGSAEKLEKDAVGGLKGVRGGVEVDLAVPTPGENGWPEKVKYAPATPVR